jgi:hypothetical protein
MTIVDDLLDAHEPWLTPDLTGYLAVIGGMFSEVEWYIGGDEFEPYELLLDPDLTRVEALPYLAQFVGERLPKGLSEAQQREWIKDAPNQRRGTLGSIVAATQRTLVGDRLVTVVLRSDGTPGDHPDDIVVITYTDETPSTAQVLRDLADVVPFDLVLHYFANPGPSWQQVEITNNSWQDVMSNYTGWTDVATARSGGSTYGR